MIRRRLSGIGVRLLLFNVLLVFLPAAGLFSLRTLESQLLDFQERAMVQQGRLAAAALSGGTAVDSVAAEQMLLRLEGRTEARIRIVDRNENVLADSALLSARRITPASANVPDGVASRRSPLYRIGTTLWRPLAIAAGVVRKAFDDSPDRPIYDASPPRSVIQQALDGRYGATVRESPGQRSLTMYSVVPIINQQDAGAIGAVVVSQSTSRILRSLWNVRLDIFRVFVISLLVAALLSILLSATIVRPLVRLRDEADDLLDHRGRLRRTFRGSKRSDEIGDLTRALERLTARFERHMHFVEGFSADVSHEFKNPLASIRGAAELLTETPDERTRKQLGATIGVEVARLDRLLNRVREVSRLDAALETDRMEPIDVTEVVTRLLESSYKTVSDVGVRIAEGAPAIIVNASGDRLIQAFRNVLDNAVSFSPKGAFVTVSVLEDGEWGVFRIDDEGPGIPPEHLARMFDRFFSYRPDTEDARRSHDGLGLAIARAVVEGYGGTIVADNRLPRGTRIEIRLPRTGR